mmetsp:Transcript_15160/g.39151  ORF Transcript_15160/g.39151 Transcript_15160/m.39151 type:complete len:210 (+) Transcript_15160:166-795(+)
MAGSLGFYRGLDAPALPLAVPLAVAACLLSLQSVGWPVKWFAWHPWLMIFAWIAVAFTSIAVKRKGGRTNTLFHGYSMVVCATMTLMGYYVIHTHKNAIGKPHLQTYHSWTGFAVIVLMAVGAIASLGALHPDGGMLRKHAAVRALHKMSFRVVTVLALVTMLSGWYKLSGGAWFSTTLLAVLEMALAVLFLSPARGIAGVTSGAKFPV